MTRRFGVEPRLAWGPAAYWWFWLLIVSFVCGLTLAGFEFLTPGLASPAINATESIAFVALLGIVFVSFCMLFLQRSRESRRGYTTLWAGEENRAQNEVDPSSGLIIREAGNNPLSKSQRKSARIHAREIALNLTASGAPYQLPFGWLKPRGH